ncbi:peroxiredoxin [Niveibacterium sp. 24ML]|uniref:peroxiredoxin n=1 Tax=Niveibacterium sp. 24ML TaxID=2985512 RepID=UPI00227057A6|nr:peroxiredoxin [Niveibacterium sp. 24ML]MCX9158023.1 peroxiredoxin [Niveibacterium sp. 24ML]
MKWLQIRSVAFTAGLLVMVGMAMGVATAATPEVGKPAPEFRLPDQEGKPHALADYRGKWLVLYFYPKNDTPGCTTEACNFRDGYGQIKAMGAQVLGVSVDDTASHLAFAKKYSLPFPLLADADGAVAERYGALTNMALVKFAKRQTFLIDPQGVLRQSWLKVDPDKHAAEVIAALKQQSAR